MLVAVSVVGLSGRGCRKVSSTPSAQRGGGCREEEIRAAGDRRRQPEAESGGTRKEVRCQDAKLVTVKLGLSLGDSVVVYLSQWLARAACHVLRCTVVLRCNSMMRIYGIWRRPGRPQRTPAALD